MPPCARAGALASVDHDAASRACAPGPKASLAALFVARRRSRGRAGRKAGLEGDLAWKAASQSWQLRHPRGRAPDPDWNRMPVYLRISDVRRSIQAVAVGLRPIRQRSPVVPAQKGSDFHRAGRHRARGLSPRVEDGGGRDHRHRDLPRAAQGPDRPGSGAQPSPRLLATASSADGAMHPHASDAERGSRRIDRRAPIHDPASPPQFADEGADRHRRRAPRRQRVDSLGVAAGFARRTRGATARARRRPAHDRGKGASAGALGALKVTTFATVPGPRGSSRWQWLRPYPALAARSGGATCALR